MALKTIAERVDDLEIVVAGLVLRIAALEERVGLLKQPVIIERIKYKNRVKPKPKRRKDLRPGFTSIKLD